MCGFIVNISPDGGASIEGRALSAIHHRGPDATGTWTSPGGECALAHQRLSIIDLSSAGNQPMATSDGRYRVVFNGEIYNHIELREELSGSFKFKTKTDTEVLLAAYIRWGNDCLRHLNGMFAFAIWDQKEHRLFAARDRFGVKPFFINVSPDGKIFLASEIKVFRAAGVQLAPDPVTWSTYLTSGIYEHSSHTFWKDITHLGAGHYLIWDKRNGLSVHQWYDLAQEVVNSGPDTRNEDDVSEELLSLLEESVRLRFRADVPVGICLSGGLDSSLLLGLIHKIKGADSDVKAFTFYCDDPMYDETPWVKTMLENTRHESVLCLLSAKDVPEVAREMQYFQDEPFGGFPTLGMHMVFKAAKEKGITVLLDGNGMDEAWAGYEYYKRINEIDTSAGPVQGSKSPSTLPGCLRPEFRALAVPLQKNRVFDDDLVNLQYLDITARKIPRAMRFADRASMMYSRELREPFLDYRILELGLRQPIENKIRNNTGKWLPRVVAARLLPNEIREAPKRPVQTPQREWLRGPLSGWAQECIQAALDGWGQQWLNPDDTWAAWKRYLNDGADNSFPIWQWISLGMMCEASKSGKQILK